MSGTDLPVAAPSDERPVETGAVSVGPTPGQQLGDARRARGLSIEDVAHTLKFSSRQLAAIEADDLNAVSGGVFLRGLVRSYARFLGLDAEALLGALSQQGPTESPEIRPPENMGVAQSRVDVQRIMPLVVVSLLLILVAGIMIGWRYLDKQYTADVTQMSTPTSAPISEQISTPARVEYTEPPALQPPAPAESAEPAPLPAAVPVPIAPAPVISAVETPAAAPVAPVPPATPATPTAPTTPAAPAAPAAPATNAVATQPAAAPSAVVTPTNKRRLVFQFQGQSWVEVKDASGLVVFSGAYQEGSRAVVGRPPFEIVIGNAGVVSLQDDGKPVDLKPYTNAEVARLRLE